MANPDVLITPGDGKIEFSGSSAGDSNSSKIRVGSNGDLHVEGSDLFVSGDLTVSGDITSSSASHEATSYTASTHVSGLSGYFGKVGIGTTNMGAAPDALTVGALVAGNTKTVQFNSEGGSEIGLKVMSRTNRAVIKVGDNDTDAHIVAEGGIRSFGAAASASTSNINVLAGGIVGIGTTSPTGKLQISTASRSTTFSPSDGATWHDLLVQNPQNTQNAAVGLAFQLNATYHVNAAAGIAAIKEHASSDYAAGLAFVTRPHAAVAEERFRITNSGNVGIGTTNPNAYDWNASSKVLEVFQNDSNGSILKLRSSNTNTVFAAGNAHLQFGNISSHPIKFYTAGSQKMVLQAAGQVGIGTTVPGTLLEVFSSAPAIAVKDGGQYATNATPHMLFKDGNGTISKIGKLNDTNTVGFDVETVSGDIRLRATSSADPELRVTSSGVGIGTQFPASNLHIGGGFSDTANDLSSPVLAIKQAGLSAEQGIYLERGGERKGYYIGIAGVDGLHFQRNFAGTKDDVLCLTRAGEVGIGTASPDSLLHLDGSAPTLTIEADGNTDDPTIILQRNDNAGLAARIQLDNSAGDVFFDNTYDHDNGDIFFRTKGTTKRVTIKGAGNVGIGTTDPISLLTVSGDTTNGQFLTTIANAGTQSEDNGLFINVGTAGSSANAVKVTTGGRSNAFIINGEGKAGLGLTASNMDAIFTVNGDASITGELRVDDAVIIVADNGNQLKLDNDGDQFTQLNFAVNGTNKAFVALDSTNNNFIVGGQGGGNKPNAITLRPDGANDILFAHSAGNIGIRNDLHVTGNVGIGTTNPASILEVAGADPILQIRDTEATVSSAISKIRIGESNDSDTINNAWDICASGEAAGLNLDFIRTNGGTKNKHGITLKYDGKVGIGTANPSVKFEVNGGADAIAKITATSTAARLDLATTSHHSFIQVIESDGRFRIYNQAAGAERFTVLNDGKVGIGTANPSAELTISGSDGRPTIRLAGEKTSDGNFADIYASNNATNGEAQISFRRVGADDATEMLFYTSAAGGSLTEQVRIDSAGKVGIGTASPATDLHIKSADPVIRLEDSSPDGVYGSIDGAGGSLILSADQGAGAASSNMQFKVDNAEAMRINSNGNVGIGTNSPASRLHLYSASDSNTILKLQGGSDTNKGAHINFLRGTTDIGSFGTKATLIGGTSNDLMFFSASNDFIYYSTAERMRIKANGKVGIATSDPGDTLHIHDGHLLFTRGVELRSKDTGGSVKTIARVNSSNELEYGWSSNGPVKFMGGGSYTERIRIHTDGNIGVGHTAPSGMLHLRGTNTAKIILENTDNATDIDIDYFNNGDAVQSRIRYSEGPGSFTFSPNVSSSSSFTTMLFNGNVGIGTTDPDEKLHISGNAIIANSHTSNTTVRIGGGLGTSANYGLGFYTQEGAVRNTLLIGSNNGGSCIRMTSQNSSTYEIWADSTALHFDSMNGNRDFYFNSNSSAENIVYITQGEGAVGIGVNPTALRGSRFAVSGDASITGKLTVASTVSSNSSNDLELQRAGTTRITLGGSSVTVNDNGENIDFRVEGDNEDNLIRTDAANDRVGIGTNSPDQLLHVYKGASGGTTIVKTEVAANSTVGFEIKKTGGTTQNWRIVDGQTVNGRLEFYDVTDSATRMIIDGDGNVGIGTISPGSLLEIYEDDSSAGNTQIHIHNDKTDDAAALKLEGKRSSANDFAQVIFANNGNNGAVIQGRRVSSNDDGALAFFTSAPGTASVVTEAMRINNTGQVGIGTSNPSFRLDLGGTSASTDSTIRFHQNDGGTAIRVGAGGGSSDVTLLRVDGDSASSPDNHAGITNNGAYGFSLKYMGARSGNSNSLSIFSDNQNAGSQVEAVTVMQDGSVGIGTSNANGSTLKVNGDVGITGELRVDNDIRVPGNRVNIGTADTTSARCNILGAGSNSNTTSLRVFRQGGSESLRVYDGGQVTVGAEAAPTATFQVNGDASITGQLIANDRIILGNTAPGHVRDIDFRRTANSTSATARLRVLEPSSTHTSAMTFSTSDADGGPNLIEAMRITHYQSVGIGVTAPQAKLQVDGDVSITGKLRVDDPIVSTSTVDCTSLGVTTAIVHDGDSDTLIGFTPNQIKITAGSTNENTLNATDTIFNSDNRNVDFHVNTDTTSNNIMVDAGTETVGIGAAASSAQQLLLKTTNSNTLPFIDFANSDGSQSSSKNVHHTTSTSTHDHQGWLKIKVNGTDRYLAFYS